MVDKAVDAVWKKQASLHRSHSTKGLTTLTYYLWYMLSSAYSPKYQNCDCCLSVCPKSLVVPYYPIIYGIG